MASALIIFLLQLLLRFFHLRYNEYEEDKFFLVEWMGQLDLH